MDKESRYQELIKSIECLIKDEPYLLSSLANITAEIKSTFNFFWVGFYIVRDGILTLGPFQGSVACTRIKKGRGVCGDAWKKEQSIIVENVEAYVGHIACSSDSRSEIVIPIFFNGEVWGELDIDSKDFSTFDEIDRIYLEKVAALLTKAIALSKF